jgi:hypothetical protein
MSAELTALRNVAALDARIFKLERERQGIPEQIRDEDRKLDGLRQQLAAKEAEYKDARVQADFKEKDLQAAEQVVIKLRNQINQAKSNKEYQTLQHEILSKESDNSRLEDAVLQQMDQVQALENQREELKKQLAAAESEVKEQHAALDKRYDELSGQIDALQKKRSAAGRDVPAEIMSKYDRLISRRGETAMVPVVNGACQGCFMQVRSETMAQLRKGGDLVFCNSCSRILYLDD